MEDEHCIVICGEWVCSGHGKWQFVIDKERLSRVVYISDSLGIRELEKVLFKFGESTCTSTVAALSYWPPNSHELTTGLTTPPVLLTSDGGVGYFLKHVRVNKSMNLFVKISRGEKRSGSGLMEEAGAYTTPIAIVKRQSVFEKGSASGKSVFGSHGASVGGLDTAGSRTKPLSFDDDALVAEVLKIEENLRSGCSTGFHTDNDFREGNVATNSDEDVPADFGDELSSEFDDVRPMDYDRVFWGPLIDDPYGGSNAAELITTILDDKGPGGTRSSTVFCTSNDAFDHFVVSNEDVHGSSGFGGMEREPIKKMDPSWSQLPTAIHNKNSGGRCNVDSRNASTRRLLADIADEEFDIPPLFHDTLYERADIPDLDRDENDEKVYVGKVYESKEDCRIALAIYAIKHRFHFKQTTTKRHYFVLSCADGRCDWRVMAGEEKDTGYYRIKKAQLNHICDIDTKNGYTKKATSRVIGAVYKSMYGNNNIGPLAMDLQQLVLKDLRISSSNMKCYRAKSIALEEVRGTKAESYLKLPEYMHCLKLGNPGTVADFETQTDDNGNKRFLYSFLAFGASIKEFRQLRRILVLDGTHLSGKYKGVLLTASGQDANFQVFPLAFAVVDSKNGDAWTWFLQKVERIVGDSDILTLISDRHTAIYSAINKVYPLAHHGCCIVHLQRNVNSKYKRPGLAKLVGKAGYAVRVGAFRAAFKDIVSASQECSLYLEGIGIAHWAHAHFAGDRYNLMTSNIAESLNKALQRARSSPILELLMFIQSMMTRWFSTRRNKSLSCTGNMPPEVEKQLDKNKRETVGNKINKVQEWGCEVVDKFSGKHTVSLNDKKCSCIYYNKIKLPCGHALIAADHFRVSYGPIIGDCYKATTWVATYEGVVNPECDAADHDMPDHVSRMVLFPPHMEKAAGRRKKENSIHRRSACKFGFTQFRKIYILEFHQLVSCIAETKNPESHN